MSGTPHQNPPLKHEVINVLSVEDNPEDADLLKRMLKRTGLEIKLVCADSLSQACQQLNRVTFDILLLDLSLRDAQGLETVERIKAVALAVPIVVLTGLMDETLGVQCVQAGAQDYLVKGHFDEMLLKRVLRYVIERQRMNDLTRITAQLQREINERKKTEAALAQARDIALESVRLKSEFMANMSHEIRTPMNSIMGMAELLSETNLSPIQKKYVDIFQKSGDHLLMLINDILDLSKVESGALHLEKIDFNLADLVENTLKLLMIRAHEKGLHLAYYVAPDVPPFLSGDPHRLRQVITNVIGNAIKFTERGDVLFRIQNEIRYGTDFHCRLQFSVVDTGIGIAPDQLNVIFESFVQGDSSITRKYGGTGLGLTISKKLVELMSGHIEVTSELGKGTRFLFTIPFETPKEAPSIMAAPNFHVQGPSEFEMKYLRSHMIDRGIANGIGRPLRILLVEDSLDNQTLILAYLQKTQHIVDLADNGEIAVRKASTASYDLIFMDMQMPVMDGYAATRAIRRWETLNKKTQKPTPIIALTACALKEEIKKSLQAGCTGHMTKPIKKTILLEVLSQYAKRDSLAA